jgi:hypothetical protein
MYDPYHVYMDLDVMNNDYNSTSKPQLRFEETRNTPFLPGDSADYFCSIVRFNIQTGNTLPVFIPRIQTGQSDINKTIYKVGFEYTHGSLKKWFFADVIYSPEDLTAPTPSPPTNSQDLSSSYYFNYNYQHFIYLVNNAIQTAWNEIDIPIGLRNTAVAPWVDFDPDTNRLFLSTPSKLFNNDLYTTTEPHMKLLFNDRMYELFASLPFRLFEDHPVGMIDFPQVLYVIRFINRYNNKYVLKVDDPASTITPKATISVDILQAHQEMTSIALWNPVASIVFASSLLPIIPTQTSAPKDIGNQSNNLISGGNNSNLLPILSDFSIAVDSNNQYRPMVEYNPGAEYRLIDMNSTTNLNRLDIIVYWKDRFGGLHPFQLQPGCAASVKLMFRRKDFSVVS